MRAILIDAKRREVKEVDITTYRDIRHLIFCETVTKGFDLPRHHVCYVDDEGLLDSPKHFFMCDYGIQPYAGNGVIVAVTPRGKETKCRFSLDEIKSKVQFLTLAEVQAGIRSGEFDYSSYITTNTGTQKIHTLTLGAYDDIEPIGKSESQDWKEQDDLQRYRDIKSA